MERRVLGKGLDALIPKRIVEPVNEEKKEFARIAINAIKPSRFQPRQEVDAKELEELSRSIKEKGMIQPIIVRKSTGNDYEVIAGARRLEASKLLGHNEIPAIIKDVDDRDAFIFAIVENLQRKDLNPLEEAEAFQRLMGEFSLGLEDIARVVAKDKTTVVNTLRLLRLPVEIKEAVKKGLINRSQARTILALDAAEDQIALLHQILSEGLPVREIEQRVRKNAKKKPYAADPFVVELEEKLQERLGTKVRIFNKRNNRGKILIEYYNLDDLERIIERMK